MHRERWYREWVKEDDLVAFTIRRKESDLFIRAETELIRESRQALKDCRDQIEDYLRRHPDFVRSLVPVEAEAEARPVVREMAEAGRRAGVGPMAAVAGAVADSVGRELLRFSRQVIVENGGDLFLASRKERILGIYAGASPFSGKLKLKIDPERTPLGICTSSGTVGHSLSFGQADAALIMADTAALADAVATAAGNLVKRPADLEKAVTFARAIEGVRGVLMIMADKMAAWGEVRLV